VRFTRVKESNEASDAVTCIVDAARLQENVGAVKKRPVDASPKVDAERSQLGSMR
jgi:hypothetical protein